MADKTPLPDFVVLMAIDPGLHNTAALVMRVPYVATAHCPEILWQQTYDLSQTNPAHPCRPNVEVALRMKIELQDAAKTYGVQRAIVEFQPPVSESRMLTLIRWNSWIEGYVICALDGLLPVVHGNPAAIKHYFKIEEPTYHKRKTACVRKARELVPSLESEKMTDHVADCILMVMHSYLTNTYYPGKI
jgi:hypothetical protein